MENYPFFIGQEILFTNELLPYKVMACSEKYVILTRPLSYKQDLDLLKEKVALGAFKSIKKAYADLKHQVIYTILDLQKKIRSCDSSVFSRFDYKSIKDCHSVITELESGKIFLSKKNAVPFLINWDKVASRKPIHAKPALYAYYYEILKGLAFKYGYNLVLHGSLNRDLDLIAIPWAEPLFSVSEMIDEFCQVLGGNLLPETHEERLRFAAKYHGRMNYVINLNRGEMPISKKPNNKFVDPQYYIDISVLPVMSFIQTVLPDPTKFKEMRTKLGLTLREVQEKTGVSYPTINRIENGQHEADYKSIKNLFVFYSQQINSTKEKCCPGNLSNGYISLCKECMAKFSICA